MLSLLKCEYKMIAAIKHVSETKHFISIFQPGTQFFKRVVDRKTGKFEFIAKQLLCRQEKEN
jgi:hypothetical protein